MPPIIIGIGILLAVGPAVSAGIITSVFLINTLIGVGLSLVLNGVTQLFHKSPTAASVAHDLGSSQVTVRQPLAPRQVTYGRDRRGGVFTYLVATGFNNKFLNMVITLDGQGMHLRPVAIRYSWPAELDLMADRASLRFAAAR
jgi:hypothetical protein